MFDLTSFVLVAAMTLAPLSAGLKAVGEASHMAAIGICGIAVAGALRSIKGRAFRLGFAASGGGFLLVSGWFHIPGVSGQPDVGLILQAALAIAIGVLGGRLAERFAATSGETEEVASARPLSS
jgi:hypothetical protein